MTEDLSRAVSMAVATLRRMRAPESMAVLALATKGAGDREEDQLSKRAPPPPMFKDDATARAILRIELTRDAEYELMSECYRGPHGDFVRQWDEYRAGKTIGPLKFLGVAMYVVERLPAPGWRVVNPLS